MDGVPGVSFPGIRPGETFVYEFPIRHAGTFWYHSNSNLQEQLGHYGPLIFDPAGADPVAYDLEHVLLPSDWSFLNPHTMLRNLKQEGGYFNSQPRTLAGWPSEIGHGAHDARVDWWTWERSGIGQTEQT